MEYVGLSILERSQPNGFETNMRGCKVRIIIYWQGALKEKRVKPVGHKQRSMCICIE